MGSQAKRSVAMAPKASLCCAVTALNPAYRGRRGANCTASGACADWPRPREAVEEKSGEQETMAGSSDIRLGEPARENRCETSAGQLGDRSGRGRLAPVGLWACCGLA